MFLSGKWLSENGNNIFSPFKAPQIDCNAYTLKIGSEVYISPESDQNSKSSIDQLYAAQTFEIRSGQFAFLITQEYVEIPQSLMAFINIKNGLKVQGLINVSGFHVDPGYSGKLIFAVFNAGPKSIILREGDDAFLMWLSRLEDPSAKFARTKKGFSSISSELASKIPRESVSLAALNKRIELIQQEFRAVKWIAGTATTLAVGLLLIFFRIK